MSYSLTYDSVDLSGASYGLKVVRHPMHILPDIRQDVTPYGGKHGAAVQGVYFEPIRFTLDWYVLGTSRADLLTKLDAIMVVVNPANGEKLLTLDAFSGWAWYAVLNGPILLQEKGVNAVSGQFNWLCADGYRVAASSTSQTVAISSTPQTWNTPLAGAVAGNLATEPTWTIRNLNASALTGVTLANTTRSESLIWTGSVTQNNYVRIDSERQYVETSLNGSTWTNAMAGLAAAAEFPQLSGGAANACSITGVTTGSIAIGYRARSL